MLGNTKTRGALLMVWLALFSWACSQSAPQGTSRHAWLLRVIDVQYRVNQDLLGVSTARDAVEARLEPKAYCDPERDSAIRDSLRAELRALAKDAQSMSLESKIPDGIRMIESQLLEIEKYHTQTWREAIQLSPAKPEDYCIFASNTGLFQLRIYQEFRDVLASAIL